MCQFASAAPSTGTSASPGDSTSRGSSDVSGAESRGRSPATYVAMTDPAQSTAGVVSKDPSRFPTGAVARQTRTAAASGAFVPASTSVSSGTVNVACVTTAAAGRV